MTISTTVGGTPHPPLYPPFYSIGLMLTGKTVSSVFYKGAIPEELARISFLKDWKYTKPFGDIQALDAIEKQRVRNVYDHVCSSTCKEKGFPFLT